MSSYPKPPRWIINCLERFCDPYLFEGIQGDLLEIFERNIDSKGLRLAQLIYLFQAIGFLRIIFKNRETENSNMRTIWINYLLTAYRSLRRHKLYFGINLVGLAIAITCALYALIFILDEVGYNQHVENKENIFRLYKHHINIPENTNLLTYETSGMMGPTIVEEYPEVLNFTRLLPWWDPMLFSYGDTHISSPEVYIADSSFIDMFDVNIISSSSSEPLQAPSSILLSESLAQSIFGDDDPIGKIIIGVNDLNFTVTGVFAPPPRQSSLQYEALISWTTTVPGTGQMPQDWMNNWRAQGIFTFLELSPNANTALLEPKFEDMMKLHFEERAENYFLKLQPFTDMYLHGANITRNRGMKTGSIQFLYLLGFSALLIFLIACVNYINISLSRSAQSQAEVGVRQVMGSTRRQLSGRFIAETFITTSAAAVVSLASVYFLIPIFNEIIGKDIERSTLLSPLILMGILFFIFGISFFIGLYPAYSLSGKPISLVLKSSAGTVKGTDWFRRSLLTFQYAISIFLIICTIAVISQTQYLLNKPLGFDQEQMMVIDLNNEVGEKAQVLKANLLTHPNISSVSVGRSAIGGGSYSTRVSPEGHEEDMSARIFRIDFDFLQTYGIQLRTGRFFRTGSKADSTNSIMVNRAYVDFVGWDDPIGKKITYASGYTSTIIGVTENFHISSLASFDIEPMIMYINTTPMFASVKIASSDLIPTIQYVIDQYDQLATRTPVNYYFVDEWFQSHYEKEEQTLKLATIYAIISILLCGLGLYGLTALILIQRKKELSIRKVLGASLTNILSLLNREFLIMIVLAFLVAVPLAYWLITDWLEQFVYGIELGLTPFAVAGLTTLLISLSIVGLLTWKMGNSNLAKNLSVE